MYSWYSQIHSDNIYWCILNSSHSTCSVQGIRTVTRCAWCRSRASTSWMTRSQRQFARPWPRVEPENYNLLQRISRHKTNLEALWYLRILSGSFFLPILLILLLLLLDNAADDVAADDDGSCLLLCSFMVYMGISWNGGTPKSVLIHF